MKLNAFSTTYSYNEAGNIQQLMRRGIIGMDGNTARSKALHVPKLHSFPTSSFKTARLVAVFGCTLIKASGSALANARAVYTLLILKTMWLVATFQGRIRTKVAGSARRQ